MRSLSELEAMIIEMRDKIAQQEAIIATMPVLRYATITGGNTITAGAVSKNGIAYSSTQIDAVPSAYDPDSSPSCIDGIGYCRTYFPRGENLLVINDTRQSLGYPMLQYFNIILFEAIQLDVTGGGTITAYTFRPAG